jgi:hypothetical protein
MTPHVATWLIFALGYLAGGLTTPVIMLVVVELIARRRQKARGLELP